MTGLGAALVLLVLMKQEIVSIDHRASGTSAAITLAGKSLNYCSGSGQGPIDCPRDYPKQKRKKR